MYILTDGERKIMVKKNGDVGSFSFFDEVDVNKIRCMSTAPSRIYRFDFELCQPVRRTIGLF